MKVLNLPAAFVLLLSVFLSTAVCADVSISDNCHIVFASKKEGGELLANNDDYIKRLSAFDRTAKLQRKKPANVKQFKKFARKQAMNWDTPEQKKMTSIMEELRPAIAPYAKFLPKNVQLVKTTGRLESGAFYTRGTAIFIPEVQVERPREVLSTVMLHEFFHIITRRNPKLRDRLYAAIGFMKTSELVLPESLRDKKISNPDVPVLTHLIKVGINGKEYWATPFIYTGGKYNFGVKRSFFQYLQLGMLAYEWDGPESDDIPEAVMIDGKPLLVPMGKVEGLFEQIGRNTQYLFHAEEVLADNFALLAQGHSVNSPEVLERMQAVFDAEGKKR